MKNIPVNAIRFCKASIAILLWCAFVFREDILLIIVFGLLLLSALLKISRAPLILLYSYSFEKIFPSKSTEVDEAAMRFAHTLGTSLSIICLLLVRLMPAIGWWAVLGFAILKTVSMLGFCPGEAVYKCIKDGTCNITGSDR